MEVYDCEMCVYAKKNDNKESRRREYFLVRERKQLKFWIQQILEERGKKCDDEKDTLENLAR